MNQGYGGAGQGIRRPSQFIAAPVSKWLLIGCVAVYFLDRMFAPGKIYLGPLTEFGFFSVALVFEKLQVWRLLGFQFLHGSAGHLLSNMIGMYFFAPMVERCLGSRRFLVYYLLCGIAGALFYSLLELLGWSSAGGWLVGASAGIFGILVALIVIAPDLQVQLLLAPVPVKMRTLGIVYLGISVFVVLTRGDNYGGEAGHLGGALLGFLLMKQPWLLDWVDDFKNGRNGGSVRRAKVVREVKLRPRTEIQLEADEVDRILDKVSEEGVHSLTERERAILLKIAEENRNHE